MFGGASFLCISCVAPHTTAVRWLRCRRCVSAAVGVAASRVGCDSLLLSHPVHAWLLSECFMHSREVCKPAAGAELQDPVHGTFSHGQMLVAVGCIVSLVSTLWCAATPSGLALQSHSQGLFLPGVATAQQSLRQIQYCPWCFVLHAMSSLLGPGTARARPSRQRQFCLGVVVPDCDNSS
jgi:hypothetical protein